MSGFVHLLFGVFHSNPKTTGPHRYVLEIFHSGGENLIPEELLTLPYIYYYYIAILYINPMKGENGISL